MPKFSVNKLGEYLSAKATRRATLIREQKNPTPFQTSRYSDARSIIVKYFLNNYDPQIIADGIKHLNQKPLTSSFQQNDKDNSIESLNAALGMVKPNLASCTLIKNVNNSHITIKGLDISVNPDILIYSKDRKGNPIIGAFKIHIIKTNPLTEEPMKYVSTMVRNWVESNKQSTEKVENKICFSVDIFSQKYEVAPKTYIRRLADIEAACVEIVTQWPNF